MIENEQGEDMNHDSLLTRREREITVLVATGASNKEIAYQLAISQKTVKNILTRVFDKTQSRSRTELAIKWLVHSSSGILLPAFDLARPLRGIQAVD